MARGRLRIYLGAAPGVGKTFAMLNEGSRGHERGKDIVVAYVETHARPNTEAQIRGLEVIPRRTVEHRGQRFEEMDLDAVLARRPEVALVDELAHTNVPGSRNAKRWQDIDEMLQAGIDVVSTVNIQHLESLSDVVQGITGVVQRERVPDHVVRAATQIELVDMSPESLRRRMAHGNIYRGDKVDAALGNYFRVGNLTALRELALLWVADRVDEGLQDYRERHGIEDPWETKERVVVALTGSPGGARLIRRGARMAARSRAELVGVHIRPTDGGRSAPELLEEHRALLVELGGRYHEVAGGDVAAALVDFARAENATQLLLGATNRSRVTEVVQGSVINQVIRRAGGMDVHVLSAEEPSSGGRRLPRLLRRGRPATLPARRVVAGWLLTAVGLPLLTVLLTQVRSGLGPTLGLPEQLLAVVVVAIVGGILPALAAALVAFALTDWYLIPPLHSFTIGRNGDIVALVTFVATALAVSLLIDRLARRSLDTVRARAESEALARMAGGSVLAGAEALPRMVEDLRATFGLDAVAVLAPTGPAPSDGWTVVASSGSPVPATPDEGVVSADLAGGSTLIVTGSAVAAGDRRLLGAFVNQLRLAQEQQELVRTAAAVSTLAEANELRTELLAAVADDLGTPLAAIKAALSRLRSSDVRWSPDAAQDHQVIRAEADRLDALVGNLLAMGRLQTGAVPLAMSRVGLEQITTAALRSLPGGGAVEVDVPPTLPRVDADPALLERAVANLVGNALTSNPGAAVTVSASVAPALPASLRAAPEEAGRPAGHGDHLVELRISDRGRGIPEEERDPVLRPGGNVGLAVARGLVEAMHGTLSLEDTPGGGLTAVVALPVALAPTTVGS